MSEAKAEVVDWTDPAVVAAKMGVAPEPSELEIEAKAEKTETKPAVEEVKAAPAEKEEGDEPEADGVMLKDGKRVLPYRVLQDARTDASEQRAKVKELETQLAQLKDAQAAVKATPGDPDAVAALAELEEDLPPGLVKVLKSTITRAEQAEKRVAAMEQSAATASKATQEEQEAAAQDAVLVEHTKAMSEVPFLKKLEGHGGPLWEQAKTISSKTWDDKAAAKDPNYRATHYKEVERQMQDLLGVTPQATQPEKPTPKPLPAAQKSVPTSLSTIPGGTPPPATESEALQDMNPMASVAMLAKMTPKQLTEYMAKTFGG